MGKGAIGTGRWERRLLRFRPEEWLFLGLAVGAAKTLATRKAAQYYQKSAGHLPKPMQHGEA